VQQYWSDVLIASGIFGGAAVSSFCGFAFSAIAGALLLHILPATKAIPLMMACSIAIQSVTLIVLRNTMNWKGSLTFTAGGILGIPPSLYVLSHSDTAILRRGFGLFLVLYSAYMLIRPAAGILKGFESRFCDTIVDFFGGLVGGLTAMPGAAPSIWCDLRGMGKHAQRGIIQPFIVCMQLFALALLLGSDALSASIVPQIAENFPALAAGTLLGLLLFGRVNDILFRRGVLLTLLASGLALCL
jgi:uncharacterized membrane protein YfcA